MGDMFKSDAAPLKYTSTPFNPNALWAAGAAAVADPKTTTYFTVWDTQPTLYKLLCAYVVENLVEEDRVSFEPRPAQHWETKKQVATIVRTSEDEEEDAIDESIVDLRLGIGIFRFSWLGEEVFALHQRCGDVVGAQCGARLLSCLTLLIAGSGRQLRLRQLCAHVLEKSRVNSAGHFSLYRFYADAMGWRRATLVGKRPMDSVILPKGIKENFLQDVRDFLRPETQRFYREHAIPYRRSYLLHGVPGSGKSSLLAAVASHFERNLCYLQPTQQHMTDDAIKKAVMTVPEGSILVLEDVDALFHKRTANEARALTFSGLLNALDGIAGSPEGLLVFLTSNHREHLDPALIRNGRVDVHVPFDYASREQIALYWQRFFKDRRDLAENFAADLWNRLDKRNMRVSTAAIQHFFIMHRNSSAEEALASAQDVITEIECRQQESNRTFDGVRSAEAPAAAPSGGGGGGGGGGRTRAKRSKRPSASSRASEPDDAAQAWKSPGVVIAAVSSAVALLSLAALIVRR